MRVNVHVRVGDAIHVQSPELTRVAGLPGYQARAVCGVIGQLGCITNASYEVTCAACLHAVKLADTTPGVVPASVRRPTQPETFMEHARVAAKRSTCPRALKYGGIGAVLVVENRIVATGYCGSMRGDDHCTDAGCEIDERTGGCTRTVHAEVNAVLNAARFGAPLEGAACYCTVSPCWDCFKALVNAGVRRIYFAELYRLGVDRQMVYADKHSIVLAEFRGDE